MSSPCAAPRCRLKDFASCFYAPRFHLDEEPRSFRSTLPQFPDESMVLNSKGRHRSRKMSRRIRAVEIWNQEGESVENLTIHGSTNSQKNEGGSSDSSWPRFSEEDYIVFYFREDGGIRMINDGSSLEPDEIQCSISRSSRRINRKLNYDEDIEEFSDHPRRGKHMVNEDDKDIHQTTEEDIAEEGDGKLSYDTDTEPPVDEIKEIDGAESSKTGSAESCDSNQSDGSTSSFAFPMLGWEWIGSPVQMPKSQAKHKSQNLLRHCCRF